MAERKIMSHSSDAKTDGLQGMISYLQTEAGSGPDAKLPPVHLWEPDHCGDIGMEIRRDGSWWHQGTRISREKLVRLFSTILRKDPDGVYLVTPYEKVIVRVEDAPFMIVRLDRSGDGREQTLIATTNVGDVFTIDETHPLRVEIDPVSKEPRPYAMVRNGLEGRIARAPFYEMVDWSESTEGSGELFIWSGGARFTLGEI